jgi:glycosyltransferase involved in cell wall biosynthesis
VKERERLSVTIITLNEEKNIRGCLESVKWADEIIVVDSGSTDRTLEICREYTDRVFINPWPGMNEQKRLASEKASNHWVLNIDADERITDELRKAIVGILKNPTFDGYRFPRKNYFLGRWMKHGGWYPDYVLRLFRKDMAYYKGTDPHDKVIIKNGKVGTIQAPLLHYTYTSLSQYFTRQNSYLTAAALERFKKKRRVSPFSIPFRTIWKFMETYLLKRGFLDGFHGLIVAMGAAFSTYQKYAKIWELSKTNKES